MSFSFLFLIVVVPIVLILVGGLVYWLARQAKGAKDAYGEARERQAEMEREIDLEKKDSD